jgi:hypothetical protein
LDFCDGYISAIIPWFKWRIDNGEWYNKPYKQAQWYKGAIHNGSELEIESPFDTSTLSLCLISLDGGKSELSQVKAENGKYQLGRIACSIGEKENIFVLGNRDGQRYELCWFSTKEHFDRCPLVFSDDKILWAPEGNFVGEETAEFIVTLVSDAVMFNIDKLTTSNSAIGDDIPHDKYTVEIKVKSKSIFKKEERVLFSGGFIVGSPEMFRFKNASIQITEVNYSSIGEQGEQKRGVLKETYGIDDLKCLFDESGKCYYVGNLYRVNGSGNKLYLGNMRDENGVLQKINPIKIELLTDNTFKLQVNADNDDNQRELYYHSDYKQITCEYRPNNIYYAAINAYRFQEVKNV